jgi:hypothetical protein
MQLCGYCIRYQPVSATFRPIGTLSTGIFCRLLHRLHRVQKQPLATLPRSQFDRITGFAAVHDGEPHLQM